MQTAAMDMEVTLGEICDALESRNGSLVFSAGSRVFEQGEPGDRAYMIEEGYVEVSHWEEGAKTVLGLLGPGEVFGEMALLDGEPRSATAIALHDTSVIAISRAQVLDAVDEASPLARLLVIAAIKRLRAMQSKAPTAVDSARSHTKKETGGDRRYASTRSVTASELKMRLDLEIAIEQEQFELAFQPVISLADGRTVGFEALCRWPRPGGRTSSPADFIPFAESTGLIVPLGEWVLEAALRALLTIERHRFARECNVFMSVNVSPRQLDSEERTERLARVIEGSGVDPARVKLEITEQTLLSDPRMAMIGLAQLKSTGAKIAIDDFGTGYSSLNYLHRYPLDTLKIDRSFVHKIARNPGGQRVVSAVIGLARELAMDVVAEGIEEFEELSWLQARGCQYGQGYLMAKPGPFHEALGNLDRIFEW